MSKEKISSWKILVLLAIALILSLTACTKYAEPQLAQEEIKAVPTPVQEQPIILQPAELAEDYACGEGTAVGYVSCQYQANGDLTLTLAKKSSQTTNYQLTGLIAVFLSLEKDPMTKANLPIGNTTVDGIAVRDNPITYTIPLSSYQSSERLEIRPIIQFGQNKDTQKICVNQRIMVIPKTNCKKI